jgi:hypothetical protein
LHHFHLLQPLADQIICQYCTLDVLRIAGHFCPITPERWPYATTTTHT